MGTVFALFQRVLKCKHFLYLAILPVLWAVFFGVPSAHAQDLGSLISPGKLSSLHQKLEGIKNCTKCHELRGGMPDEKCLKCHLDIGALIKADHGYHASVKSDDCIKCHTDHKGRDFKLIDWDEKKFDHNKTGYRLIDKHKKVLCKNCHKFTTSKGQPTYLGLKQTCTSCHTDVHKAQLGKNCENCHNIKGWTGRNLKFNHDKAYKLEYKHRNVKCEKCHTQKYLYSVKDFEKCLTCHVKDDVHKGKLGESCESCHTAKGWKNLTFDHQTTRYPLLGKHRAVKCESCHTQRGVFKVKKFEKCVSCHKKDDIHKDQLGSTCESCHKVTGWKKLRFNHQKTEYPLRGKHLDVKCQSCHVNQKKGEYKVAEFGSCNSPGCHDTKKRGNIHGEQFKGERCEKCHTLFGWQPTLFKHEDPKYEGYKLKGRHAAVDCKNCHRKDRKGTAVYKPIDSSTCDAPGCHDTKRRGNIHGKQFKGQRCDSCHNEKRWKLPIFKHEDPAYTGYKLQGKHADLRCKNCHRPDRTRTVVYKPIDTSSCDAPGCHDTKKRGNIHGRQFKGQSCDSCHTLEGWRPSLFKHEDPKYKGYKLKGKHASQRCEKCHRPDSIKRVRYKPFDTSSCDSPGCHDIYDRGNIHGNQFKGKECQECHTENGWNELDFDHNRQSKFSLQGKHEQTDCVKCHTYKVWKPLKDKCIDCHKKNDVHKGEFGSECERCHTAVDWKPKDFDHKLTDFDLRGAHNQVECEDCHKTEGEYKGLRTDCAACHRGPHFNQFDGFCETCHNENTWEPLKFRHGETGFRLQGIHRMTDCVDCHANRNYAAVSSDCYSCHAREFADATASQWHQSGNTECGDCHTTYSWAPAYRYQHDSMTFTGAHKAIEKDCDSCHVSNSATLLYSATGESDCYTCHTADYTSYWVHTTTNDTDCTNCHNTTTWQGATYEHTGMTFSGAHASIKSDCDQCHNTSTGNLLYSGAASESDCYTCHENDFGSNYAHGSDTTCSDCHSTSTWSGASFAHSSMTFTGAHSSIKSDCSRCHINNSSQLRWSGASSESDCVICHLDDFNNTNESAHNGVDPNQCSSCHSTYTFDD